MDPIEITPQGDGGCLLQLTATMSPEWKDHVDRARTGWKAILFSLQDALA